MHHVGNVNSPHCEYFVSASVAVTIAIHSLYSIQKTANKSNMVTHFDENHLQQTTVIVQN